MSQYPPPQYPQQPNPQQPNPQSPNYPQQPQYPQQQYPSPYSPYSMPQVHPVAYAQTQYQNLLSRFRRAGLMLFVTGGLMSACGLFCGAGAMAVPAATWEQRIAAMPMDPAAREIMTVSFLRALSAGMGVGALAFGVLAIILGIFVRRGSMGASITGSILTVVMALPFGVLLAGVPGAVSSGGGAEAMMGLCMSIVPLVLLIWQLVWLIGAAKSASGLAAAQAQMQMQYWQYMAAQQQYQQAYAQGYGQQKGQGTEQKGQGTGDKGQGGEQPPQGPVGGQG